MKKHKQKKCVICQTQFMPSLTTQRVCSLKCSIDFGKNKVAKIAQTEWNARKKEMKEKTLTQKCYENSLQNWINKLIRLIDKDQTCISSGRYRGQMQAGHFWTVQAYPNLRYNLFNIFAQSSHDNNYKSGNVNQYRIRIIKLFGSEIMDLIDGLNLRYPICKPTKIEIKEKIEVVKECIKEAKLLPKLTQSQRIEYRVLYQKRIGIYK